jgi:acyl carrier protein
MPTDAVYEKLSEILRDVFDDEALVARPDLTADQVDGWDSFAHLRLITTIERAFSVRFTASQVAALQNVGDLTELVRAKLAVSA